MENVKGSIHSIETFGSVDGPGVRYIVFLNGCQMRCMYCHNADTWKMKEADQSVDDVLKKALRYKSYWGKEGGITISGGEPLLQIDFLLALFQKAKKLGIHTVIDTCGNPFTRKEPFFSKFQELMKVCDLLLVDIKHIQEEKHIAITTKSNQNIVDMIHYLDSIHQPIWIRHVLVPGLNDREEELQELHAFIASLSNVERVELLPYHNLGVYKWEELGYEYQLKHTMPPSEDALAKANEILQTKKYQKYVGKR